MEFYSQLMTAWRKTQESIPCVRCIMTMRGYLRFIVFDVRDATIPVSDKIRSDNDN